MVTTQNNKADSYELPSKQSKKKETDETKQYIL